MINLNPSWGSLRPPGVTSDPFGCTSRKSLTPHRQAHFYLSMLSASFASRTEGSRIPGSPSRYIAGNGSNPWKMCPGRQGAHSPVPHLSKEKWPCSLQALLCSLISCHVSWIELSGLGEGWRARHPGRPPSDKSLLALPVCQIGCRTWSMGVLDSGQLPALG